MRIWNWFYIECCGFEFPNRYVCKKNIRHDVIDFHLLKWLYDMHKKNFFEKNKYTFNPIQKLGLNPDSIIFFSILLAYINKGNIEGSVDIHI